MGWVLVYRSLPLSGVRYARYVINWLWHTAVAAPVSAAIGVRNAGYLEQHSRWQKVASEEVGQ